MTEVAVVIPAYNGARFLADAVESVYGQTVQPSEVVVVNDGSTDCTESVLRELSSMLPRSFRWWTISNSGGPATPRNLGVSRTTAEYVAFLDQDDVWHPAKLELQLGQLSRCSDAVLSFTGYRMIDGAEVRVVQQDDWTADPQLIFARLMRSPAAVGPPSTAMVRRSALQRLPPFDTRVGFSDDWKMWLQMAAAGMRMEYLRDALVDYRWHGENLSTGRTNRLNSAARMFDVFFGESELPSAVRRHGSRCRAYWHLEVAIDAARHGNNAIARRHVLNAVRIRPRSIRPGWLRILAAHTFP